ncbi:hypothetical protein BDK51DRAFT_32064 [Blyttiomyces helicus]|uniref:Uncharacterized protein n=1 Tax=Blyttiomyces helicus TaxID=388810 RepID=A0A4V1ISR4_9FUNG|nr:hypothetical protein BDK51DRAFT_32064 [Blyttiomyces helicus]|eukprot:RKO94467.1 hypothetical protein BDK51DRAFT_32064 [Blyttiomyces helicus]
MVKGASASLARKAAALSWQSARLLSGNLEVVGSNPTSGGGSKLVKAYFYLAGDPELPLSSPPFDEHRACVYLADDPELPLSSPPFDDGATTKRGLLTLLLMIAHLTLLLMMAQQIRGGISVFFEEIQPSMKKIASLRSEGPRSETRRRKALVFTHRVLDPHRAATNDRVGVEFNFSVIPGGLVGSAVLFAPDQRTKSSGKLASFAAPRGSFRLRASSELVVLVAAGRTPSLSCAGYFTRGKDMRLRFVDKRARFAVFVEQIDPDSLQNSL